MTMPQFETPQGEYKVLSQVPDTRFDPATAAISQGWQISYRDNRTRVVDKIFIPDAVYNADSVRQAILYRLSIIRDVHGLSD